MTRNQQYVAQMVAARVVAKAKSITDEMRAIADRELIDNFNFPGENGRQKSIDVMHDGVHLGTFTVIEPQPSAYVKDEDALKDWLAIHNPSALEVTVTIRKNVLDTMLKVEGLVLADEDGGPVYRKKDGEVLPGVATKLAGLAKSTRLSAFTGKTGAAKREARDEVLDRLAANFDVEQLAAQHDATKKAIEANPPVQGTVVEPESPLGPEADRILREREAEIAAELDETFAPDPTVPDLGAMLKLARENATGEDAEEIRPGITWAEAKAAAWHATVAQGGFSTPENEADRMVADRARADRVADRLDDQAEQDAAAS
jgi:hypothetical protein